MMPEVDEEIRRLDVWTQYIRVEDMRNLAKEALRRVAQRDGPAIAAHQSTPSETAQIETLCGILLNEPFERAHAFVLDLFAQGLPLERVYHDHLGAAAIRLGEMWENDEISFFEVTRGVARIIVLMRNLRERAPAPRLTKAAPILFAAVPGETHALGVTMARDLFREQGWDVKLLVGFDHDALIERIAETDARALGLSCGSPATAGALARLILAVRLVRPSLPILVSGQMMAQHGDLAKAMGPDSTVTSIKDAVPEIERLTMLSVQ